MNDINDWAMQDDTGNRWGCFCHGPCDCGEAYGGHYAKDAPTADDTCLDCGSVVRHGTCLRCKTNLY